MVTAARIGCDGAEQMAQSVLAVAADAKPEAAHGLAVVVRRSTSAETELAAAEVATARSAAANLRQIENELLAEIEAIIGRADSPQLGDEQALRELHAMLAKARGHVRGPLARAEKRSAERLAAAREAETANRKNRGNTERPNDTVCQRVEVLARRIELNARGDVFRAWCSHCRSAARARRLVDRWRSARLRAALHGMHAICRLLAAQKKQETYRLALSELQDRVATQEESRAELLQRLAEAGTEPTLSPVDLRSRRSAAVSPERVVMAVDLATTPLGNAALSCYHSDSQRDDQHAQDVVAPLHSAAGFSKIRTSSENDDSSIVLGMIKLCGHRRQEAHGMFARPYLIYEYEVSVGTEVWQGEKRYTDFEQLHNNVVDTLGAAAADLMEMRNMELPPKRYVGNLTPAVGDERLLVLQHYLTQLGHLASPAAAASGELPQKSVSALHSALFRFVKQRHQVIAADFVVAAAASYFERIEHLREAFAKCDTKGTGRLTEAEITRFLAADSNFSSAPFTENSNVAAELRELRGSGLINRLKETLAAEVAGSDNDGGLTLVDVESWWSQHCLRTQSASTHS
eukprot:COSAG02_NODE_98_length_37150_cov_39.614207_21_plen_576_part_00